MKADKNLLSGSTTLLVLSLLSTGDKYGYEMIAELDARSDHTFTLKEGTLYPILHGLEKEGAVKSYTKEADTGRTRKHYRITRKGLKALEEQKKEVETDLETAIQKGRRCGLSDEDIRTLFDLIMEG